MKVTLIPKDANHPFGGVEVRNDNYKPGQPCFCFYHGLGQDGDGSIAALHKLETAGYLNVPNDPHSFFANADKFGYNVFCVQTGKVGTVDFYSSGEIPYAEKYAREVLQADPNMIPGVFLSLGGYGLAKEVDKNPMLPLLFSSLSIFVMGPGTRPGTAPALANSKRPIWFITSADDHNKDPATGIGTNSGTSFQVTDDLYKTVKSLGGNAWETKFKNRGHTPTFTFFNNDSLWLLPIMFVAEADFITNPAVNWYQWVFNNPKGTVKSPMEPYIPYVPVPPTPAPIPKKAKYILFDNGTWEPAA